MISVNLCHRMRVFVSYSPLDNGDDDDYHDNAVNDADDDHR